MSPPDDASSYDDHLQEYSTLDGIVHKASNEALSIVMGINMLSTLPESLLTPHQFRALKLLETSAANLVRLMDDLKSKDFSKGEH